MLQNEDVKYMRRAIELAKAGEGWVHPNPLVGAMIVKDGRIIGEGYHRKFGELHAERNAIADVRQRAGTDAEAALEGATIYVTLEPCCHYGKTPPCTEAIIENRIARVVIGSRDPNPLVAGKGAQILREAGIEVAEDFLREECDALNPVFFHYISTKRPYVIMKYAMTADGKIATKTGASKWITGEAAREEVQRMRHACMGIMAGIGTVLADDPLLNCRMKDSSIKAGCGDERSCSNEHNDIGSRRGDDHDSSIVCYGVRHPIRIICDSRLRIPADSRICRTAGEYETIVACADPSMPEGELLLDHPPGINLQEHLPGVCVSGAGVPGGGASDDDISDAGHPGREEPITVKIRRLRQMGVTVLNVPDADGNVDLQQLMALLGQRGIDSILLEGGGGLNDSALRAGIVSEVRAFIAPKFFGGEAKSPVEGIGVDTPDQAVQMKLIGTEIFGDDLMLRYRL